MSYQIIDGLTLATAVAPLGNLPAVAYKDGATGGLFAGGVQHKVVMNGVTLLAPHQVSMSFGATSVTITNQTAQAFPAGSTFIVELQIPGEEVRVGPTAFRPKGVTSGHFLNVSFGTPATASSTLFAASQSISANGSAVLTTTGGVNVDGTTVLSFPDYAVGRNVVAAWTNSATVTVSGFDVYGKAMTESKTGTSFTGVKAFYRITSITASAAVTGFTAGTGVVLGFPFHISNTTGFQFREVVNGALAGTAGTFVAGLSSGPSSATTADVRGTYAPNSAPNGSNTYQVLAAGLAPDFIGAPQA
jgi:hypothetical protein